MPPKAPFNFINIVHSQVCFIISYDFTEQKCALVNFANILFIFSLLTKSFHDFVGFQWTVFNSKRYLETKHNTNDIIQTTELLKIFVCYYDLKWIITYHLSLANFLQTTSNFPRHFEFAFFAIFCVSSPVFYSALVGPRQISWIAHQKNCRTGEKPDFPPDGLVAHELVFAVLNGSEFEFMQMNKT